MQTGTSFTPLPKHTEQTITTCIKIMAFNAVAKRQDVSVNTASKATKVAAKSQKTIIQEKMSKAKNVS